MVQKTNKSDKITVFIDGSEGTTGLRLAGRLEAREDVRLLQISPELRKDPEERARISNQADIVFLCLPDGPAREAAANITKETVRIIDTSTAHRVAESWDYGLPELSSLHRKAIEESSRVSVPGCHAMGFALLASPLVRGGAVTADYPFTCHSLTGYSGGGKGVIAQYQAESREEYLSYSRHYALGQQHKHLPEMQKVPGLTHAPVFNPIICDFYSGMVVTVPLHMRLLQKYPSAMDLHDYFTRFYAGQKLVQVMPFGAEQELPGGMMNPDALAGRDYAQIFVCGHGERAVLMARYDNLGKGASGAAIQCMNIMCGLDEATGLELAPTEK